MLAPLPRQMHRYSESGERPENLASCRGELREQEPIIEAPTIAFKLAVKLQVALLDLQRQGKLSWDRLWMSHERDMDRILKTFKKREAYKGDAYVQFNLGIIYFCCRGVPHARRPYDFLQRRQSKGMLYRNIIPWNHVPIGPKRASEL